MALMDFVKRAMPADAYKPTATLGALRNGGAMNANPAFAAASQREFGLDYYLRSALAGGICCGFTHGAVTPVDVVKVRVLRARFRFSLEVCDERVVAKKTKETDDCRLKFLDAHAIGSGQVRRHALWFP
jgi:hypothetical protein